MIFERKLFVIRFINPLKSTLQLDWADVIEWLKSQGKGYQTRINGILRREMLKSIKERGNFV